MSATIWFLAGWSGMVLFRYFTGWPFPVDGDAAASLAAVALIAVAAEHRAVSRYRRLVLDTIGDVKAYINR